MIVGDNYPECFFLHTLMTMMRISMMKAAEAHPNVMARNLSSDS
jgi:hypothetical protein